MEAWEMQMKKILEKGKKTTSSSGFNIGVVITPLPNISVSIGNDIILEKDDLVIANHVYIKHTHLLAGDKVILIPDASGQQYALIDKVGE